MLADLLEDWQADHPPAFEGVHVIGHQWSAQTHQVKDFLARNLVPYRFSNVETDPEAEKLLGLAGAASALESACGVELASLVNTTMRTGRLGEKPDDEALSAAFQVGKRMSLDQAVAFALRRQDLSSGRVALPGGA